MSDNETKLDVLKSKVEELQGALEVANMTFTEQLEQAEKRQEDEVTRTCMELELKSLRELVFDSSSTSSGSNGARSRV